MSVSNASGTSSDIVLNTGSFEMERMLRQNAHEKAFEIKVLAQRQFEKARDKEIIKGRKNLKEDQDKKISKLNQDLNIQRSKMINSARLTKMNERNKYFNMQFIEFLEFICRLSDFLYNPQGIEAELSSDSDDDDTFIFPKGHRFEFPNISVPEY